MGLHLEEDLTFTFPTMRHPIAILTATLAGLTAHRAGTAIAVPSPEHSWQDLTSSHQTKWKLFTKLMKSNNALLILIPLVVNLLCVVVFTKPEKEMQHSKMY